MRYNTYRVILNRKAEYLADPIGSDIVKPRFFRNCEGGEKQPAYRIIRRRSGWQLVEKDSNHSDLSNGGLIWI